MDSRLSAVGIHFAPNDNGKVTQLPQQILQSFSEAMAQAMLLCSGVMVIGLIAVLGFQQSRHLQNQRPSRGAEDQPRQTSS